MFKFVIGMDKKIKLTIIGAGNIGGATALGLAKAARVTVTARTQKTLDRFAGTGIITSPDNLEAVKDADIVIFAVKPWLMEEVVKSVLPALDLSVQTVVSMAPGIKSAQLVEWLGPQAHIAYAIPNTAIEFGESMTFIVPVSTSEQQTEQLRTLFEVAGSTLVVKEDMLVAGTSLASCGIAYALRYIQASSNGGVQLGFGPEEAVDVVTQTVRGACAILEARGKTPQEEIDKVTTPGGMTLKGLDAMERSGFTDAVVSGLKANSQ